MRSALWLSLQLQSHRLLGLTRERRLPICSDTGAVAENAGEAARHKLYEALQPQ